jgi:hypothetical protein
MPADTPPSDDLQFARAEPAAGYTPDADGLACAECRQPIDLYYFEVGGQVVCAGCKGKLEAAIRGEGTSRGGRVTRALLYGGAAMVLGAAIWFGVYVATGWQHALVAILIGWMIGTAVHKASAGRGGRRYQVIATVMTYCSVALSYGALGIREMVNEKNAPAVTADSTATRAGAAVSSAATSTSASAAAAGDEAADDDDAAVAADSTGADAASEGSLGVAVLFMLGFMFVLPIIANLSDMPGGLIGIAIIGFGIHQAWKMNQAVAITITGPHRVGSAPRPAGDAPAA